LTVKKSDRDDVYEITEGYKNLHRSTNGKRSIDNSATPSTYITLPEICNRLTTVYTQGHSTKQGADAAAVTETAEQILSQLDIHLEMALVRFFEQEDQQVMQVYILPSLRSVTTPTLRRV
jgi:hypothetical protein